MKKIVARKLHACKKCKANIYCGFACYPQRRKKYLCEKCGDNLKQKPRRTFIQWLADLIK